MAGPYAIAAVGKAILSMLAAAVPKPEFTGATFELYQSKNLQAPMEEGVSLYLHRITPGSALRNLPPRIGLDGRRFRPSMPLDLHYLLIAWARDAFKQQRLLGWAMRTIEDTPLLHASLLNQYGPEPDTFGEGDSVDVLLETISIQDLGTMWDAAKTQMQPCAAYIVRMVSVESRVEMPDAGLVQTRIIDAGKLVTA
jgi:Pvc16 N-terminal domain